MQSFVLVYFKGSNKHLTGTRVDVDGNIFLCEYTPSFANADLTGLTQVGLSQATRVHIMPVHAKQTNKPP